MARRVRLSAADARRIALAAQGFDRARADGSADIRHFRRVVNTLGLLQLDFVNVLVPAHYLVMFSRLGAYDRRRFEQFIYGRREFTEQWAHEASIVPVSTWPLLAHRRAAWQPWKNNPIAKLPNRESYLRRVLEQVEADGALSADQLPPVAGPRRKAGDWHRSVPRWALEFHFGRGKLAVSERRPNFQRVYDLPRRVVPPEHLAQTVARPDAHRMLLQRAADALGIATLQDLADYFRMSPRDAAPRVQELADAGKIAPVSVENWKEPAYLSARARCPRRIDGASLLSPFDPVVWFRPRAERLFGFHYRIEIYVPAEKRKWGYYVLPFRMRDRIVARVDLKADRKSGTLLVRQAHLEDGADPDRCAAELAAELRALADWLELDSVRIRRRGVFENLLRRQQCLQRPTRR